MTSAETAIQPRRAESHLQAVRDAAGETVVAQWLAVAAARAEAVAVRTPDGSITYAELAARAQDRGRAIAAAVPDRDRPVAVETESDIDSVAAILAVLCSGRPLVLLDPFLPDDRRGHILELSGARELSPAEIRALPAAPEPVPEPAPGDIAVLIFTSGSTGRPKGVAHTQRGWTNQARDGREFMGLRPDDRAAVLLQLSFGAGFDCLVMTLINGATMLLWDVRRRSAADLRDWLDREAATTAHATPSLLRAWLAGSAGADGAGRTGGLNDLRLLSVCGEPSHHSDVELARRTVLSRGTFCCWSGSSETGDLAFNLFPRDRAVVPGPLAAGTPAAGKRIRIVGDDGDDVPVGQTGEIVVESRYLAAGYHRDRALTADRFVRLDDGRTRFYTGDLGRFDETGDLLLLGRLDDAIKVRGYRVEPAEVEFALRQLPWAVDAAVVADRDAGELTGYLAVDPATWAPAPSEVRAALRDSLPEWMAPRHIVVLTEFPRTERGKVDRAALPPPPERVIEPVRGPTEAALAALWCTVLGLDEVGRSEDFTALGGDSLAAARMLADLRDRWLVDLSTAEFAETPTVAGLAVLLDDAHRDRAQTAARGTLSRLRDGTGVPLFFAAGAGSPAAALLPVVRELPGDGPVYGLQAHGLEQRGRADRSIRAAARRAIREIRAVQPAGPYRFAGYSYGGFVMLEAAAILHGRGERANVVLIDTLFEPELRARLAAGRDGEAVAGTADTGDTLPLPDRRTTGTATGAATFTASAVPPARGTGARMLSAWNRAWNRAAMRFLVATAGLWRLPATLQWTVFWDLGRASIRQHRPTPYPGSVTMIAAESNPDDPATWSLLATGGVTEVRVPGDHHSMMRAPFAAGTAAAVHAALAANTGAEEGTGDDEYSDDE